MLSTLSLHTLQAPATRHVQAVRTPLLVASGLSTVSSSRSAYAGIATFRNGSALRSTVASGPWPCKLGRKSLSVSSAAATDVQEETHEYQAEVHRGSLYNFTYLNTQPAWAPKLEAGASDQ